MASGGFSFKVKKSGRIKPPNLDHGKLTEIGLQMVAAQKKRWELGLNASGNRAKPLTKRYAFLKRGIRRIQNPVRDMYLTGLTRDNFGLRKAIDNQIRAENTSRETRKRAQRSQNYEQMIGFSGQDQVAVFKASLTAYGEYLKKAWVPLG